MAPSLGDSIRTLFKGGLFAVFGLVIEMGISFLAKVVMARYLGKLDYGAVSAGVTVLGIASTVVLLGLHTGVARYLSRDDSPSFRRGVILSAASIWVPLSLLTGAALYLFAGPIAAIVFKDPSAEPVLRIFALTIPLASFSKFVIETTRGVQRTLPKVVIDNVTIPLLRFTGVSAAFIFGLGALGVSAAYLGAYVGATIFGVYFIVTQTAVLDRVEPDYSHRELISFSLPLLVSGVAGMIYADLDTIIVGFFWGTQAIADYHVVYPVAQLVTLGLTGFSFIFMPVFSELHASAAHSEMNRLYQVVTKWIAIGTFPIFLGLTIFPDQVITATFGAKYTTGSLALVVLGMAFYLHALLGPNAKAMIAAGHSGAVMRITLIAGAANLVLNLLVVPTYSYLGAAVATALTYTGMNLGYSTFLYRRYGLYPYSPALLRPLIGASAIFVLMYVPFSFVADQSVLQVVVFMSFFAVIMFVSAIRLGGIESEELVLLEETEAHFDVDLSRIRSYLEGFVSGE